METGHEAEVAEIVRKGRQQAALSQEDLAARACLAAKTVQRMEAGRPVAAGSRRAVFEALGLDPTQIGGGRVQPGPAPWRRADNTNRLFEELSAASSVRIELDRDEWRRAREARPWYRQDVIILVGDPVDAILEIADQAATGVLARGTPGVAAKAQDDFGEAVRAATKCSWALARAIDDSGALTLYIGSPREVARRTESAG